MSYAPLPPRNWREPLQVIAQVAAVIACLAAVTMATITIMNYRAQNAASIDSVRIERR
jgi:uncharacterized integral membrane protein